MIEFFNNFHFIRPYFLLFLLIPLFLFFKKAMRSKSASSWEDICDKKLLNFLLVEGSNKKTISIKKYIYVGLIFAAISAAGPAWKKVELPTFVAENPNMFVFSLSQDMQLTDIYPSRLERTKYVIHDITKALDEGQFGLMVYSSEPYIITPITDDIELIKNLLPEIVTNIVPDNGDRLDRALDLAIERFINSGYKKGNIIIFASDVGQQFNLALAAAEKAKSMNFTVNIIDASFDGNEKLKILAQKGGGEYASVRNSTPQLVINKLKTLQIDDLKENKNKRSNYLDFGYYLVFIPMFCLLLFFRRGLLIVLLCFYSFSAQAGFLQNQNQEGLSLFNKGQYDEAYNKFTDNNWRSIALYKQNMLEDALKEIQKENSSLAYYNKGVMLTKLCKYEEALAAFSKSYEIDSSNNDAKYNIDILNNLFELAKKDSSLLDCNNNQNQQSQNNSSDDKNQENNNQSDNSDNNDKSNSDEEEKQDNTDKNNDNSDNQQNEASGKNNSDTDKQNKPEDNSSDKEDANKDSSNNDSSMDNSSAQNNESEETNAADNKEESSENTSDEKESEKNDGTDNQNTNSSQASLDEQENSLDEDYGSKASSSVMDGVKTDEEADEEALALQRRYREIPDDVGGLLREFIKKDYMRNRYNDETF